MHPIHPRAFGRLILVAVVAFCSDWGGGRAHAQCPDFNKVWSTLGNGVDGPSTVYAVEELPNGDLIVGGNFTSVASVPASRIARWSGGVQGAWSALGEGLQSLEYCCVRTITAVSGKGFVVGGSFYTAGDVTSYHVAWWDEDTATWRDLDEGMSNPVWSLATMPDGDLVAGGAFYSAGGVSAAKIARWDWASQSWSPLGAGMNSDVLAITSRDNGEVIAGGFFSQAGGTPASGIARWDGSEWSALGAGVGWPFPSLVYVSSLLCASNGDVVAGGQFMSAGGKTAWGIARWDGTAWWPLGSKGVGPAGSVVSALAVMNDGTIVAGGSFETAGGVPAKNVARWDGVQWKPLGAGRTQTVTTLAARSTGDLIAGGMFPQCIARFGCPALGCLADCDESGELDVDDFICFQTLFAVADPKADCDQSGVLDTNDFVCFQTAFALGC